MDQYHQTNPPTELKSVVMSRYCKHGVFTSDCNDPECDKPKRRANDLTLPFSLRISLALLALEEMQNEARGPGGHEVHMGFRRAITALRHAIRHQEAREEKNLSQT